MHRVFKFAGILVALLAFSWSSRASAEEYGSGFGFDISVPEVWLVLTRGEVADNAALLMDDGDDAALASLDPEVRREIFGRIRRGEVEIFYRREGAIRSFVDNVNVMKQSAQLPSSDSELAHLCGVLPEEFSRVFGRPVAIDACEMRERVGRRALYLQFDGVVPGTTSFQYQLQRRRGTVLVVTATAADENAPRMMSEFEQMVSSIRLR